MESASRLRPVVVGIKPWKRWQLDPLLRAFYGAPIYRLDPQRALRLPSLRDRAVLLWAAREPQGFANRIAACGGHLIRMEDGFLRSVGLGSNHVGAHSLVLDTVGIYFDPRSPSQLERLLEEGPDDPPLLARAARLRCHLVERGLTKYNVGDRQPVSIAARPGQARILVPGQVDDDASVRLGSTVVRTNLELLRKVRETCPSAWIVYKPHPDTEAGTRRGRLKDSDVLQFADQIVRGVSVVSLFPVVDVVHTMTSLVGFEALLRGLPVHTWGLPFYAGWGLTSDYLSLPRRTRRLSLDQLVAATLILYPLYFDPHTGSRCEVEDIARQLAGSGSADMRRQRSALRRLGRQCLGMMRALRP